MHDFPADYGNYKIDLANPNAACNGNYKNYLDNYFSPVGTRIKNFLGKKGIVGFKLNNLQTIDMTECDLKMNINILASEELT
ncbi:hypothetical protein, conserved [Plasmodium ovale]|uniref:PIR protein n=1 Tax=Plasmodium ovale TaxID=36330 RepID=A0A1C3KKL2_PLAOA|nr:hypothetical protein, conserved [Plasmodium ovale]SBT74523.1 hypothetical protein, conserved [Plasmodium ovale]